MTNYSLVLIHRLNGGGGGGGRRGGGWILGGSHKFQGERRGNQSPIKYRGGTKES